MAYSMLDSFRRPAAAACTVCPLAFAQAIRRVMCLAVNSPLATLPCAIISLYLIHRPSLPCAAVLTLKHCLFSTPSHNTLVFLLPYRRPALCAYPYVPSRSCSQPGPPAMPQSCLPFAHSHTSLPILVVSTNLVMLMVPRLPTACHHHPLLFC